MVFKLKPPEGSDKEKLGLKDAFYQEYLLVEVHHKATQALDLDGSADTGASYSNQFLAIPKSKVFRPHCATPWPSIKGVMHAGVDGEDGGTPYAQIDDKGRYKVRFPFDMGDAGDGGASRWVRKSEAYAGPSQGMHFPLLKGAEVLIVFIDGDPDRPIISGAVFNEQNTSVVHQHNHTTNQIITPIGNTLTIDDTQGAPQIIMYTEAEKNKIVFDGSSGSEKITIKCDVSNSKIRFGKSDGEATPEKVTNADGIYMSADGDLNLVSGANTKMNAGALFEQAVGGDANIHIVGKKDEKVDGDHAAKTLGVTDDIMIGDYKVVNLAAKVALSAGATATAQVGAEAKIAYALSASCTRGDGISATWGASLKYDKSKSFTIGSDVWGLFIKSKIEQKALTEIKLDSAGKVVVAAGTQLMLRCGKSTITMTPAKIVIGSPQIVIGANAKIEVSSKGKIDVKASGPLTTKGAVVKDN